MKKTLLNCCSIWLLKVIKQTCQSYSLHNTVTFLVHVIIGEGKSLSAKAIQKIPKPATKKQLLSFLGMCSYCCTFIPNYAILEAPLSALTHGKGLQSHDKVKWTKEAENVFVRLKIQLQSAPSPFVQTVDERNGCMTSVQLQDHGCRLRPVTYFSSKLNPVTAGLPKCLKAVAAAEKAMMASQEIIGYADVTLRVSRAVSMILMKKKSLHLSTARWIRYHTVLLKKPNVTVKRCSVLNLATEGEEEELCCVTVLEDVCKPQPDFRETPFDNADMMLFVEGSAFRDPETGKNKIIYAVTTEHDVLLSGSLIAISLFSPSG